MRAPWREARRQGPLVFAGALVVLVVALASSDAPRLTIDDGFYYFAIAEHVARGEGSTFDGREPTNGYHPLWLWILVLLHGPLAAPHPALEGAMLVQIVLAAGAATALFFVTRRQASAAGAAVATLLWLLVQRRVLLGGTELALNAALLATAMLLHARPADERRPDLLGWACALAALTRLENTLLAGMVALFDRWQRPAAGRSARLVLPTLLLVGPYLALSLVLFGHAMPVSGAVKRSWSQALLESDPLTPFSPLIAKVANLFWPLLPPWDLQRGLLAVGLLAALVLLSRTARSAAPPPRLAPFALHAVLLWLAYGILFHGEWSRPIWYYPLPTMLGAIFVGRLLAPSPSSAPRRRLAWALAALLGLWAPARDLHRALQPPPTWTADIAAAIDSLPESAVIGSWNGGRIAYLSQRRVVNLDGLVSSWRFFERDRRNLCAYFEAAGVTHLVDAFLHPPRGPIPSFSGHPPADFERCRDRLRRTWSLPLGGRRPTYDIYELQPASSTVEGDGHV